MEEKKKLSPEQRVNEKARALNMWTRGLLAQELGCSSQAVVDKIERHNTKHPDTKIKATKQFSSGKGHATKGYPDNVLAKLKAMDEVEVEDIPEEAPPPAPRRA